jgi:hypothetical protein
MGPQRRARPAAATAAAALLLLVAVAAILPVLVAAGPTKWTVLVYMVADNDLECFGVDDLAVG